MGFPVILTHVTASRIKITFNPIHSNKIKHAKLINFHQICKVVLQKDKKTIAKSVKPSQLDPGWRQADIWTTSENWFIDAYRPDEPSYYLHYPEGKGSYTNNKKKSAWMIDEPQFTVHGLSRINELLYHKDKNPKGKYIQLGMHFLTMAVCQEGNDKPNRQWYEGTSWRWYLTSEDYWGKGSNIPGPSSWRGKVYHEMYYGTLPEFFVTAVNKYRKKTGKD